MYRSSPKPARRGHGTRNSFAASEALARPRDRDDEGVSYIPGRHQRQTSDGVSMPSDDTSSSANTANSRTITSVASSVGKGASSVASSVAGGGMSTLRTLGLAKKKKKKKKPKERKGETLRSTTPESSPNLRERHRTTRPSKDDDRKKVRRGSQRRLDPFASGGQVSSNGRMTSEGSNYSTSSAASATSAKSAPVSHRGGAQPKRKKKSRQQAPIDQLETIASERLLGLHRAVSSQPNMSKNSPAHVPHRRSDPSETDYARSNSGPNNLSHVPQRSRNLRFSPQPKTTDSLMDSGSESEDSTFARLRMVKPRKPPATSSTTPPLGTGPGYGRALTPPREWRPGAVAARDEARPPRRMSRSLSPTVRTRLMQSEEDEDRRSTGASTASAADRSVGSKANSSSSVGHKATRENLVKDSRNKFNMGKIYFNTKKYDKAKENFLGALRARMVLVGPEHPIVAEVHEQLGNLARERGEYVAAKRHYDAAIKILQKASKEQAAQRARERVKKAKQSDDVRVNKLLEGTKQQSFDEPSEDVNVILRRVQSILDDLENECSDNESLESLADKSLPLPNLAPRKTRGKKSADWMGPEAPPPTSRPMRKTSSFSDFQTAFRKKEADVTDSEGEEDSKAGIGEAPWKEETKSWWRNFGFGTAAATAPTTTAVKPPPPERQVKRSASESAFPQSAPMRPGSPLTSAPRGKTAESEASTAKPSPAVLTSQKPPAANRVAFAGKTTAPARERGSWDGVMTQMPGERRKGVVDGQSDERDDIYDDLLRRGPNLVMNHPTDHWGEMSELGESLQTMAGPVARPRDDDDESSVGSKSSKGSIGRRFRTHKMRRAPVERGGEEGGDVSSQDSSKPRPGLARTMRHGGAHDMGYMASVNLPSVALQRGTTHMIDPEFNLSPVREGDSSPLYQSPQDVHPSHASGGAFEERRGHTDLRKSLKEIKEEAQEKSWTQRMIGRLKGKSSETQSDIESQTREEVPWQTHDHHHHKRVVVEGLEEARLLNADETDDSNDDMRAALELIRDGDYETALGCLRSALHARVVALGTDDVQVSLVRERIGNVLVKMGRYHDAERSYELALRNLRAKVGNINEDVARLLACRGDLYRKMGKASLALACYDESLSVRRELLAIDRRVGMQPSIGTSHVLHSAGVVHARRGSFESATSKFSSIVKQKNDDAEAEDVVPYVLNSIANIRFKQGEFMQAISYYKKALKGHLELGGKRHKAEMCGISCNLGKAYFEAKQYDSAIECLTKAAKMFENSDFDNKDLEVASVWTKLGSAYMMKKDYEVAMNYYMRSLKTKHVLLKDDDHPEILLTRHSIALVLCKQGRFDDAMTIFEDIKSKRLMSGRNRDPDFAKLLIDMSSVYLRIGGAEELEKADQHCDLAVQMLLEFRIPESHPYLCQVRHVVRKINSKSRRHLFKQ